MIIASINGLDLLVFGIALAALAWIITTAPMPEGWGEDPPEEPEERYEVIVSCASPEEQEEVYHYLAAEVEHAEDGMPWDVYVYVEGDPYIDTRRSNV